MPEIVVPSTGDRLKEMISARRGLAAAVALIAVIVVTSFAMFVLNRPAQIAPPATAGAPAAPPEAPASTIGPSPASHPLTAQAAAGSILVHVDGAVRNPGLYSLPQGARVADAVDAAGGPRPSADLRALNLAEPLADGQKLDVPAKGEAAAETPTVPVAPASPAPGATASPATVVDLNSADQAALETLPEVGPVTAAAILQYRDESGGFSSVEQLLDVDGIGPATLEAMRPFVTV
jgi:competence protein ComEA